MNIEGCAAIVTGAASGLGLATAHELTAAGGRVAVFDLDEVGGRRAAEAVGGLFARVEISDEASVMDGLAAARKAHGPARILVSCAGIGGPPIRTSGRSGPYPLDVFRKLVEVNLVGSFNVARLCAHEMASQEPFENGERGVVVNVSSINAFDGPVGTIGYTAAKAGVAGMTLTMARDLAPRGIRVCAIAPGNFETPMLMGAPKEFLDELLTRVPFPNDRFGDPADFAGLARHICENAMLNGEVIRLDAAVRHSQHR